MDDFKEGMKAWVLQNRGTLEETEDFYGFEEGWDRFSRLLDLCIKTPPLAGDDLPDTVKNERKRSRRTK